MNVLFVVPNFERSKDGVADYTALLASSCLTLGHSVAIIAWNDTFVRKEYEMETFKSKVLVMRLGEIPNSQKQEKARSFIASFQPNVVSLQMVCFGFHPRGWIFGLGDSIKNVLPSNAIIEIMFHELWLGLASNHPWREKINGWVQKYALQQFWKKLSPKVVHTSNSIYYSKLLAMGLPVQYLPLPSNIPVFPDPDKDWIFTELALTKENRSNTFVFLLFGTIHAGWDTSAFFSKIMHLAGQRDVYVASIGSQGGGVEIWNEMIKNENYNCKFKKLGFRSDEQISAFLQFADAGISTTPLSLLGKSGTAMAMIEHGLPIVVTRDELRFTFPIVKIEHCYELVHYWDTLSSFEELKRGNFIHDKMTEVGTHFIADVSAEQNS